jgi:hypothetical protein
LGTAPCGGALRSDVGGSAASDGYTDRKVWDAPATVVTVSTAAVGGVSVPAGGTPSSPATCTGSTPFAPSGALGAPAPVRVSTSRCGVTATK